MLDCFASGWCRTLKCLGSRLPKPRLVLWLSQPAVWDSVPFSLFALLPFPNSNPLRFDQMVQISISRPRRCLWCSFPLFYFLQCLHYKIHGPTNRFLNSTHLVYLSIHCLFYNSKIRFFIFPPKRLLLALAKSENFRNIKYIYIK